MAIIVSIKGKGIENLLDKAFKTAIFTSNLPFSRSRSKNGGGSLKLKSNTGIQEPQPRADCTVTTAFAFLKRWLIDFDANGSCVTDKAGVLLLRNYDNASMHDAFFDKVICFYFM